MQGQRLSRRLLRLLSLQPRRLAEGVLKESELQRSVIEMARLFGWRIAHFRTAQSKKGHWITPVGADGKGFPDLCCVRERVIFIELKVNYRGLSPEQEVWRDKIKAAGGEWHLLTDKGWEMGRAEEILQHPHTSVASVRLGGDAT